MLAQELISHFIITHYFKCENKKHSLKAKVENVIRETLKQDLTIGSAKLEVEELSASPHSDVQSQLLQEIRQKLFGRNATLRGS